MTFRPNELAEKRANESDDCRKWTPRDALLACLRDLENGEINPERLVISYAVRVDETSVDYNFYAANVTTMEHAGLLAMQLHRVTGR